jgi:carbamoyltransferase
MADGLDAWLTTEFRRLASGYENANLLFTEHHLSHAASAFFPSPFKLAAILTMDGVGEWATTSLAIGNGNDLKIHKELHFPHSLGLLYSAFTYYTGFKVNSGVQGHGSRALWPTKICPDDLGQHP